jgi:hypothetical protein
MSMMFTGVSVAGTTSYWAPDWLALEEVESINELKAGIAQAIEGQDTTLSFEFSASFTETLTEEQLHDIFNEVQENVVNDFDESNIYSVAVFYDSTDKTGGLEIVYFNSETNLVEVDSIIDSFVLGLDAGLTQAEKVRAVYDFILSEFTFGESTEILERNIPSGLNGGLVVCQAYALLATRMLTEIGVTNRTIIGDANGSHIWNMVNIDGQWYHFDATWGDTGIQPANQEKFFLTSDAVMDVTHDWIFANYDVAPSVYVAPIVPPVITVEPYDTNPTKQDIVVTVTTDKGTLNATSHTFTENGTFEFVATDGESVTTKSVTIGNIDKVAPIITIGAYSTEVTDQDITVTASVNEGTLNANSHTFTENGSFEFIATDSVGNESRTTVQITNIDKTPVEPEVAPIISVEPYATTPTNQDVTVVVSTDIGTLNFTSHTFTENGTFEFVATDGGLSTTLTVTISNIDKTAPVITLGDYTTELTNQDITVTATVNEGSLNAVSHTFTGNDSFDFIATDDAGNTSTLAVVVNNIDKVAPVITIGDYTTEVTDQDITVNATVNEGNLNAVSHTFVENGSFEFIATDDAGNVTTQMVTISNIDKTVVETPVAPVITIAPYNTSLTNQDVTVTVTTDKGTLNEASYTFTQNGSFTFTATDGELVTNEIVTITNIDKIAPIITIGNYTTEVTNQDITVTATVNEGTLNNASHTFTENGSFEFTATDEAGNNSSVTVVINNIDKSVPEEPVYTLPVITVVPYSTSLTNQDLTVYVSVDKGVLNANSYTFTENGTFEFVVTDDGFTATAVVTITNIDKVAPTITIGNYSTEVTDQDITVTASSNEGTLNVTTYTFTSNGSFDFIATDDAGNVTTQTITISNIDKEPTPEPTEPTPAPTPSPAPSPTPAPVIAPTPVTPVTKVPLTVEQIAVKVEEVKTESVKTVETFKTTLTSMTSMALTRNIANSVMLVNNEPIKIDVKPFIVDKKTQTILVPIKFVTEGFGFELKWIKGAGINKAGRVVLEKEGTRLIFDMNSNVAYVNGKAVKIDSLPSVVNGRAYLSIDTIIQLLDIHVQIEKTTRGYQLQFDDIKIN